jgi:hypothetical protein
MLNIKTDFLSGLTLNIDINQKIDLIPKSESIKKFIDSEIEKILEESLQEDRDIEIVSFRPLKNYFFRPFFNNIPSYSAVGFNSNLLLTNNIFKEESFYLFDLYDNFVDSNQNFISRNFIKMSKLNFTSATEIDINFNNLSDTNLIQKEYTKIYIPSYFMDTTADTFYLKISFFNSTNGKLRFFQCSESLNNNSKNYFKIKLNKNNFTYEIIGNQYVVLQNINNVRITYKISSVIETKKEENLNENNTNILPIIKTKNIITTKGKFI